MALSSSGAAYTTSGYYAGWRKVAVGPGMVYQDLSAFRGLWVDITTTHEILFAFHSEAGFTLNTSGDAAPGTAFVAAKFPANATRAIFIDHQRPVIGFMAVADTDGDNADPDAIITSTATFASDSGPTTLDDTDLDGAVGDDPISPPRNITITIASDADWLESVITVNGLDEYGVAQSEEFDVPAGGTSTVLVGSKLFSAVTSVVTPQLTDAGDGAATGQVGVGSLVSPEATIEAVISSSNLLGE